VNNDRTETDQWDPAIAVKPGGTELFIGYYSRQNDPASNSLIMAYGAKGNIASGLASATFECFPISPTSFPPLFNGTNDVENMQFDTLLGPGAPLCWDAYARIVCQPAPRGSGPSCPTNTVGTAAGSQEWFQDDNTWADAHTNYFYYAWSDLSSTYTNNFWWTWGTTNAWPTNYTSRPMADVKFAIIKQ
jgi:hypothetical protein